VVAVSAHTEGGHQDAMIWALATRVGMAASEVAEKEEAEEDHGEVEEAEALATMSTSTSRSKLIASAR